MPSWLIAPFGMRSLFRWGYPYFILYVCAVHITVGAGLFVQQRTVSLLVISGMNRFLEFPHVDRYVLGAVLIAGAIMAVVGIVLEGHVRPKVCLALLIVQYGLVVAATLSSVLVLFAGKNPGTNAPVDRALIAVVLCYGIYAGVFHTLSIVERFVIAPRKVT